MFPGCEGGFDPVVWGGCRSEVTSRQQVLESERARFAWSNRREGEAARKRVICVQEAEQPDILSVWLS